MNRGYVISILALVSISALLFYGPVPQDESYHDFSDKRSFLDIPNFLDVITNLPLAIVGLLGLPAATRLAKKKLRLIIILLFVAFLLLTFGSGYYHQQPNNVTLVYDRLPIGIIISCFFAFIVYDRINVSAGFVLYVVLSVLSVLSVLYWIITEAEGRGDLRWYAFVQFFPILAIPLILWLYKSPLKHGKEVIPIFLFFGLAKLTESLDEQIFELTNRIISGHSLKHLFMALAGFYIVKLVRRRTGFMLNS
jgi:hypothetical protein